jgi:uncharacterized protein YjiS (DUF1127 family)
MHKILSLPLRALTLIVRAEARSRERRGLEALDDRLLADIGITRAELNDAFCGTREVDQLRGTLSAQEAIG